MWLPGDWLFFPQWPGFFVAGNGHCEPHADGTWAEVTHFNRTNPPNERIEDTATRGQARC